MGFCTSLFLPGRIETEVLPASIAELKGVLIQNCAADITVMDFHPHHHQSEIQLLKNKMFLFGSFVFRKFGLVSNFVLRISDFLSHPLRGKLRDLMGGIKGFVEGPHGILHLFCLNNTGATGDRGADG